MTVGLHVEEQDWELGSGAFFHAFFSTVAVRLEGRWGSRFPRLMTDLYNGELPPDGVDAAIEELDQISREFRMLPPDQVVWDAQDPDARPPWGDNIADTVTNLGNYWWTSDGHELLGVIRAALTAARERRQPVTVE